MLNSKVYARIWFSLNPVLVGRDRSGKLPGNDEEDDGASSGWAATNKAFTKAKTPSNAVQNSLTQQ